VFVPPIDKKNVALMVGGVVIAGLIGVALGPIAAICAFGILLVLSIVLWRSGTRDEEDQADLANIFSRREVSPSIVQPSGPEIMLSFRKRPDEDDGHLFVQHTGGGSARNVHLERITVGDWIGDSDTIPHLPVGGAAKISTKFIPNTPAAKTAQANGGIMLMFVFVMKSVDGLQNIVTVRHEDALCQWDYETDFEIIGDASTYMISCYQRARRIKQHSSS
jgi:hypothetical protein